VKASSRPVVNAGTAGVGAPVVSVVEDVTAAIASVLAVLAPILGALFIFAATYLVYRVMKTGIGRLRANVRPPADSRQG
jgi:hypothetical protein